MRVAAEGFFQNVGAKVPALSLRAAMASFSERSAMKHVYRKFGRDRHMDRKLDEKVAIVTGAAGGIGSAIGGDSSATGQPYRRPINTTMVSVHFIKTRDCRSVRAYSQRI